MTTLLVSQPNFADHVTPQGHPERADRIRAVEDALKSPRFDRLMRRNAPTGDLMLAELVHDARYLAHLRQGRPAEGIGQLDADTFISANSLSAAATGLGGALAALDAVLLGEADNAFCAIRPPGHHAEIATPMGFCLINTVAIVAREAQRKYGAERVAIVDFDVHHGNGTQDIFYDRPDVLYVSIHADPVMDYPYYWGHADETGAAAGAGATLNFPLPRGTDWIGYEPALVSALERIALHEPDLLIVSYGADTYESDPISHFKLKTADYAPMARRIAALGLPTVVVMEGGYAVEALGANVSTFLSGF